MHAVYPGSFDPVTMGHLDIIRRASRMFDELTVVVAHNYNKASGWFTPQERMDLIRQCTRDLPNVSVDSCDGLLADYVRRTGAAIVVKGLRAMSDFEQEFQQALVNRKLNPDMETAFIASGEEYMYLSSSVIKQICSLGGDFSEFVPPAVHEAMIRRIANHN